MGKLYYTQYTLLSNVMQLLIFFWKTKYKNAQRIIICRNSLRVTLRYWQNVSNSEFYEDYKALGTHLANPSQILSMQSL